MKITAKKAFPLIFGLGFMMSKAEIIIVDDVEGNGDDVADVGAITTAWAGWEGATGTPWFNLLDLADDDDGLTPNDPLIVRNGVIPFQDSSANPNEVEPFNPTVTYNETLKAGTYTVTLQIVNWGNFDFPDLAYTLGGVSPSLFGTNPTPAAEQDEIHTLSFVVSSGDPEIGDPLTFIIFPTTPENGSNRDNFGIDHVTIDFEPEVVVDTDNDGLPDPYEEANGLIVGVDDSALDEDANGGPDGLTNLEEFLNSTDPQDSDSDDDGLSDGEEVNGTVNTYQTNVAGDAPTTAPGLKTDPLDSDSDDDTILDGEETQEGVDGHITNPNQADTDGDNLPDAFEANGGLDPTDSTGLNGEFGDFDSDDSDNAAELIIGTNPSLFDTDMDGVRDGYETNSGEWLSFEETGTDPLNSDSDNDGLLDGQEDFDSGFTLDGFFYISDPNFADTDDDGFPDGDEVTAQTDPNDDASVPVATVLTVEPLVNGDFEQPDVNAGENAAFEGWGQSAFTLTVEPVGFRDGSYLNTSGANTQVGMTFVRDANPVGFFSQNVVGTTDLNATNHSLNALEAAGATFSTRVRIGMESFDQWPTGYTLIRVGLRTQQSQTWQDSQIIYSGTQEQATAAGVTAEVDVYLGLNGDDPNGAGTMYQASFTVPASPENGAEGLVFAFETSQVETGDQARGVFDDIILVQGGVENLPALPAANPLLTGAAFNGDAFEITVADLDVNRMYVLQRSESLEDEFPTTIGVAFTPASTTQILSDPNPPVGKAFYRVEEVVSAP